MFDATNACNLALQQIDLGETQDAISTAEQAISQYPDDSKLWEVAGMGYFLSGDIEKAVQKLETATTLAPLSQQGQMVLAKCYRRMKMPAASKSIIDFMVERFVGRTLHSEMLTPLVLELAETQDYKTALELCEAAFERDETDGHACFGIAWYRLMLGEQLQLLLPWFQKAVLLEPGCVHYRISLGFAYSELFDYRSAVTVYRGLKLEHIQSIECRGCLQEILGLLSVHAPSSDVIAYVRAQLRLV